MPIQGTCEHCGHTPEGYSSARIYAGHGMYVLLCSECQMIAARLLRAHVPQPAKPKKASPQCVRCEGTGVIETGNDDCPYSPCSCPAGDEATFSVPGPRGTVKGWEIKRGRVR